MPLKHKYDEEENLVRVEGAGKLSISEIETYAESLLNNPRIKLGFIEILSLRGVKDYNFTFDSGRKLSRLYQRLFEEKGLRGSIHLSPEEMQYGLSNIMSAILEDVSTVYTVKEREEISLAIKLL